MSEEKLLYTYKHRPIQIQVKPEWIDWTYQYIADLRDQEGPDVERRARDLKAYKLATIAFASAYGLMDQWEKKQQKLSIWPAWVDFEVGGEKIRVVSVVGEEEKQFGYKVTGKVWRREYESESHSLYVLAVWWAPYVDFLGWITRTELPNFPAPWGYSLQEPAVYPMQTIPIKRLRL